jgi:hypothetical protein
MSFKYRDRVQWQEGGAGQFTCTGSIINEEKNFDGTNPFGFWTVRVDDEHYHRACRTATEMNMHWVVRSTKLNKLRQAESAPMTGSPNTQPVL